MAKPWMPGSYGWLRFGVGTLLFLVSCAGGLMGGFRIGYERGAAQYIADHLETKEYGVADLVTLRPQLGDVEFLTETIESVVGTGYGGWLKWGGKGEIQFNRDHVSFEVTHTQAAQRKVEACLATLRGGESVSNLRIQQFAVGDLVVERGKSDRHDGFERASFVQAVRSLAPPLQGYDPGSASVYGVTASGEMQVYASAAAQRRIARHLEALRKLKYQRADAEEQAAVPNETAAR